MHVALSKDIPASHSWQLLRKSPIVIAPNVNIF